MMEIGVRKRKHIARTYCLYAFRSVVCPGRGGHVIPPPLPHGQATHSLIRRGLPQAALKLHSGTTIKFPEPATVDTNTFVVLYYCCLPCYVHS